MMRRWLFCAIAFLVPVAANALWPLIQGGANPAPPVSLKDPRYFPNLPVVNQDGKTLRFYDDAIKGKIVLINFMFTGCSALCPLTTARLAEVQDKLGGRVGRDIFFYSISLDPQEVRGQFSRWSRLAVPDRQA
jgi:protein SCO1